MESPMRCLRGAALEKIALLSAAPTRNGARKSDITRLCEACPAPKILAANHANGGDGSPVSLSQSPMTVEELDVLLALCKAGPFIEDETNAKRLLMQLYPYILEVHVQSFAPSPSLYLVEPSPWEALSYNLLSAVFSIGLKHVPLRSVALDCATGYLRACLDIVRPVILGSNYEKGPPDHGSADETLKFAAMSVSLLGFFDAVSAYVHCFDVRGRLTLIGMLRRILTEDFMVAVEGAFSSLRTSETMSRSHKDWRSYTKHYASSGRPLGAMLLQRGYMRLLVSASSLQVATPTQLEHGDIHDILMSNTLSQPSVTHSDDVALVEILSDISAEQIRLLEDGSDYLQLGSAWQQRLAFTVKAYALTTFLNCMIVDEEVADVDILMTWLEDTITDQVQMADDTLSRVVLRSMAVIAKRYPAIASAFSRSLPRFIVQGGLRGSTVTEAANSLAFILRLLSQDAVITGLYSLGNVLSTGSTTEKGIGVSSRANGKDDPHHITNYTQHSIGSAISLAGMNGDEETTMVYENIIRAIVTIADFCQEDKISALAQSMLLQKLGRINLAVDVEIITASASLATPGGIVEFKSLLRLYSRFAHDGTVQGNEALLAAVTRARLHLSKVLPRESPLLHVYLVHLLEAIVSRGDVHESDNTHQADFELAAHEITHLLRPLADLVANHPDAIDFEHDENVAQLHCEAWFNTVVHGITPTSPMGKPYSQELRTLAMYSQPLIAKDRAGQFHNEIKLNTVLRRGMNGPHAADLKRRLISYLPRSESDIRSLDYPEVVFLSAAYLLEILRAASSNCSHLLTYFLDPGFNESDIGKVMKAISDEALGIYLQTTLSRPNEDSAAPIVATQLASMFTGCCHRISKVQEIAALCADRIIDRMPSSLCQKSSLFALLELLTIMWASCLEEEIDEYEWKSTYVSPRTKVSVELSDDYALRKRTLNGFYRRAKGWVTKVVNIAPQDVKGLLQTYLSEYDDNGAYGYVSLGRSFALEMGSVIPLTDHRLGAIDRYGDCNTNTASDFIAQYTTRQEYRYADALPDHDHNWTKFMPTNAETVISGSCASRDVEEMEKLLAVLEQRGLARQHIPTSEIRDILRRTAALLCRSKKDHCAIVRYLVKIPFNVFTKQSIKLGISLWLGVINENPIMEPRILIEIAESWELTVRKKLGVFSEKLRHPDPFYVKEEFAPSDKLALLKRQQVANSMIGPQVRILQFLASHFNATRLGSSHVQRIFYRMVTATLIGLKESSGHPLAREFHFQSILLGLNILRYSTGLEMAAQWSLKDIILSAALKWFSHQPRWSFGGNRLQIKAEVGLMADVEVVLKIVEHVALKPLGILQSLAPKQELLSLLLKDEQIRLMVWLFPLDHDKRRLFGYGASEHADKPAVADVVLLRLLKVAWAEDASLAVRLAARFPSPTTSNEVRSLLLSAPDLAIGEPDAIQILLGDALPVDVAFQLRYLLYWAPVNPITAVTYFKPEYGNNPYILQYAMRALESHSVDVTFFYVPQIVQTLRYDALGYVQRYIVETAKVSQLFAHQIIWNMKANAYKDEDSTIEDPLKPTLDAVMENMIASFSSIDKAFYEREFTFFNEITDISGKLRPFIKRSKPEKKQKIEEELRKIKVEVGVYLPSNPDGEVIGIDRRSGKPLQSHAKAPYMATFRIKKNKGSLGGTEDMLEKSNKNFETNDNQLSTESTYEVWQSAIFKVGDDCRQDVLALQMIAAFRGIFNCVGLDVYVYPYRVTATAPGCGVIDVLPNSISRDMLGREAVNGLYDYFVSKYGTEDSIRFQEARHNFVKSMAAYSVISYLLQFKDRHNGNIMIDDAGHILHIDFGFCFDIAPGGVRFERAPFKLTSEMVAVMGGSTESQSYRWFEELCIKAFLASRQYTDKLSHLVMLMMDSGLPCFKPDTINHFRDRFVLHKSEREAADFMKDLIKKSYSSYSTNVYDQFQLLTNGIPY